MQLLWTVLEIVSPIFLLAGIGFTWVKLGLEYRVEFVTRLAMTLSLPCLIFVSLMQSEIDSSTLRNLSVAAGGVYVLTAIVMIAVTALFRLDRRTYLAPLVFGNTGNLGLPLVLFAFGNEGLGYGVIVLAVSLLLQFSVGIWMVSGDSSISKLIREPSVSAILLGVLFLLNDWQTPVFLTNTLSLVGQMVIPIMLITLGVAVARLKPGKLLLSLGLSTLKLILCATIAWVLSGQLALNPVASAVLILQAATPVAVTSYMLAQKYGADAEGVAGMVVVSTLISVAALPLLLAFLL